jgi:hypothetical protein
MLHPALSTRRGPAGRDRSSFQFRALKQQKIRGRTDRNLAHVGKPMILALALP